MLSILIKIPALVHFMSIGLLILYGIHRIWFLYKWYQIKNRPEPVQVHDPLPENLPCVTIQLPLYNEQFVAGRLIDAVSKIKWPNHLLEIQVLDDSTDKTVEIVNERVDFWRSEGIDIHVTRRKNRTGYKAGALSNGLKHARGDYIAIFDADFIPPTDFLYKTIPHFKNPLVGMVQARWRFLNSSYSWLTAVQTVLIGHHFDIEHRVRSEEKFFFNFNGTAGIWRKETIETSGGWQSDTVTEDLDLSYRAQMNGWEFVYLNNYSVPSELPVTISSFRKQQQRWAMGSVQTAIKIIPELLKTSLPPGVKREAMFHLFANFYWLIGCIAIITLFPAILWRADIGKYQVISFDLPLFLASFGAILFYFFCYSMTLKKKNLFEFLLVPFLCIGLAPGIAVKVIRGCFVKGGIFERTPKLGIKNDSGIKTTGHPYHHASIKYVLLNFPFVLYSFFPIFWAINRKTWISVPLLLCLPAGFIMVMLNDIIEFKKPRGNIS